MQVFYSDVKKNNDEEEDFEIHTNIIQTLMKHKRMLALNLAMRNMITTFSLLLHEMLYCKM